jgi:site-specific DNA recombinase
LKRRVATRTKAVIYARVSSKEQEAEGFSVDAQLRLLRAYAAEQQVDVAKEFIEAETAKQSGRRAFGAMLKFLQANPGHIILVEKVDRLYRNFADYVKVDHLGVELHFVKDSMVIGESSKSQDKFMHGIRVLMAKNYVDNLSEEIRKGLNEKAAQGIYPTHAPLGYLNAQEPGTKRKIIVPDPARAHLVKDLFHEYAIGNHSIRSLVILARKWGLTTKKGLPLPKSAIEQILKHPAYCGLIRWQGTESVGIHEPLITKETWDMVQDIMSGRNTVTGFGSKNFTFQGMVTCECGKMMTGELKKGKYIYYHCTGEKREQCGRPYVSEQKLDAAFAELLRSFAVPERILDWMADGLKEADKDRQNRTAVRTSKIQTELGTLKARLEQLYVDKLEGETTSEFYKETKAKWESRMTELQLELAAIARVEPTSIDNAMRILELTATAHVRFKNADSTQKRELLKRVLSNSVWRVGKLHVGLHEVFDLMLKTVISVIPESASEDEQKLFLVKSVDWWRLGGSNP